MKPKLICTFLMVFMLLTFVSTYAVKRQDRQKHLIY